MSHDGGKFVWRAVEKNMPVAVVVPSCLRKLRGAKDGATAIPKSKSGPDLRRL